MRAAKAWAPASTARQSLPVAITTASTPFMMPLLWVAARYGSSSAKRDALTMPSMTSLAAPSSSVARHVGRDAAAHAHAALVAEVREDAQADARRRRARRARSATRLGDGVDEVGAHRVAAVDEHVHDDDRRRAEDARLDLARAAAARDEAGDGARRRARGARPACATDARGRGAASRTSRTWICAIISGGSTSATKPPPARTILAAFDAAATTLGSSMTIGTTWSWPLTRTLSATPNGQRVGAEDVLDELVGGLGVEAAPVERALDVPGVGAGRVADERAALLRR